MVHTFGDSDWRAVLDQLRDLHLIDAANAPLDGAGRPRIRRPAREPASARERLEAALALWDEGRPLGHTMAALYCRLRGLEQALPRAQALRHHGEVPVSVYRPGGFDARPSSPTFRHRTDTMWRSRLPILGPTAGARSTRNLRAWSPPEGAFGADRWGPGQGRRGVR